MYAEKYSVTRKKKVLVPDPSIGNSILQKIFDELFRVHDKLCAYEKLALVCWVNFDIGVIFHFWGGVGQGYD